MIKSQNHQLKFKPYKLLEQTESGKTVSLYKCNFCDQGNVCFSMFINWSYSSVYRGHNSIVYHCRRHIGDYPYRCDDCGFVEVCKVMSGSICFETCFWSHKLNSRFSLACHLTWTGRDTRTVVKSTRRPFRDRMLRKFPPKLPQKRALAIW